MNRSELIKALKKEGFIIEDGFGTDLRDIRKNAEEYKEFLIEELCAISTVSSVLNWAISDEREGTRPFPYDTSELNRLKDVLVFMVGLRHNYDITSSDAYFDYDAIYRATKGDLFGGKTLCSWLNFMDTVIECVEQERR